MRTLQFFGYGPLKNRSFIKTIIGRDPGVGIPAIVEGFQLAYQTLEQIPKNVRSILEKVWGAGFRAYTLRSGSGIVAGVIWELTEAELIRIRQWDFIGSWRELADVSARTSSGESVAVISDMVSDTQPIKDTVDGMFYEENLNPEGTWIVEEYFREEELDRVREQLKEMQLLHHQPHIA